MNYSRHPNNPSRPISRKWAPMLREDEPEKDIETLGKDEMRILRLALGDRAKALFEWAYELKTLGYSEAHDKLMNERNKTLELHDKINECWQVDLIPEN